MNRFYQVRRLRGAAFLILIGVLALLNQWRVLSWNQSWPLFLILLGVLILAERAAWTADMRDQQAAQALGPMNAVPINPGPSTYPAGSWSGGSEGMSPPPPENPANGEHS